MRLLTAMGFPSVRHWSGGLEEWTASGGRLEVATRRPRADAGSTVGAGLLARLSGMSFASLLASWLALIVAFAAAFWLAALAGPALLEQGHPIAADAHGLRTSLYFSFVTATSVGFGDVTPVGLARALAILEAVLALLLFGVVVSKMVTRRQDELIEEIHRTTFEMRLGRVRTNLHLVLSDLQELAERCSGPGTDAGRLLPRVESAVLVLLGELRAVHDLLYRPQQAPAEDTLEAILAEMASALAELAHVIECAGPARRTPQLESGARAVVRTAGEICGECVPREHAPHLRASMDRVQGLARRVEASLAG